MDQSQDLSRILERDPDDNEHLFQNDRPPREDNIEPYDFGFDRSFASMNLEFTNSYRFQPSTSYLRDYTEPNTVSCSNATAVYEPNSTFGSPSKYSKQV